MEGSYIQVFCNINGSYVYNVTQYVKNTFENIYYIKLNISTLGGFLSSYKYFVKLLTILNASIFLTSQMQN